MEEQAAQGTEEVGKEPCFEFSGILVGIALKDGLLRTFSCLRTWVTS